MIIYVGANELQSGSDRFHLFSTRESAFEFIRSAPLTRDVATFQTPSTNQMLLYLATRGKRGNAIRIDGGVR